MTVTLSPVGHGQFGKPLFVALKTVGGLAGSEGSTRQSDSGGLMWWPHVLQGFGCLRQPDPVACLLGQTTLVFVFCVYVDCYKKSN